MKVMITDEGTTRDNHVRACVYDDAGSMVEVLEIRVADHETQSEAFNRLLSRIKFDDEGVSLS